MLSLEFKIFADVPTFNRITRTKVVQKNLSQGWHKIRKSKIKNLLGHTLLINEINCIFITLELMSSFNTIRFLKDMSKKKRIFEYKGHLK